MSPLAIVSDHGSTILRENVKKFLSVGLLAVLGCTAKEPAQSPQSLSEAGVQSPTSIDEEESAHAKVEAVESSPGPFNVQAVRMALFDASDASTSKCFGAELRNAQGRVQVTFAPDGTVSDAEFLSAEHLSSEARRCVLEVFAQQEIPAFSGFPKTVAKKVPTTREAKASFLAMVLGCEGAPVERYAEEHGVMGVPEERGPDWVESDLLDSGSCKLGSDDKISACVVVVDGVARGAWVMSPSLSEEATWCLTSQLMDSAYPSDAGASVVRLSR